MTFKNPTRRWGKPLVLALLMLMLLMALDMVSGVVSEREGRWHEAQAGVAESLSGAQIVIGPMLQRQCTERWETVQGTGKDRKTVTEENRVTLAATPTKLTVEANARIEPLHRSIFRINGYVAATTLDAQWSDLSDWKPTRDHPGSRIECAPATLLLAVGDARGLRSAEVKVQEQSLRVEPGTGHASHPRGLHVTLPEAMLPAGGITQPLHARLSIDLAGTEHFAIAPVGEANQVHLRSDWAHPSFGGRFLPTSREIGEAGFDARWTISALATTAPYEMLTGSQRCGYGQEPTSALKSERVAYSAEAATVAAVAVASGEAPAASSHNNTCIESFGVAFVDPVSTYQLDRRATKYGLLFIVLTWVGVGLVEVLRRLRVHPMQYLLVGAALVVFFLLLVSLSEHLAFGPSYGIAAGACTLLLAFYGSHVLGGWRAGLGLGAGVAALYGTLYVLLQMEQTALLLGAVMLFVVLAGVMVVTRRVDWYGLSAQVSDAATSAVTAPSAPAPAPTATTAP